MASPKSILISGEGTNSLTYIVPGGVTVDVESILVNVDASLAAGDVTAELTVLEQSGVVIAAKPQTSTIPAGSTGRATWALRLDDSAAATSTSGFLKWGANTDSSHLGLTLTGHGAFAFSTGGNSFSTTTANGGYSVSAGTGGISFDASAPGTFDVATHNSDFNLHSSNASVGTGTSAGTTMSVSGINVTIGASGGITVECTGGDVFVNSKASGKTILRSQSEIVIQDGSGNSILELV